MNEPSGTVLYMSVRSKSKAHEVIRTLIVDDSPIIRSTISNLLESNSDLEIVGTAANGCEAIDLAKRCKPSLVLMDVQMPCLDGIATTMRLMSELPLARVILMSVHDYPELRSMCRKSGAIGFIPKERLQMELGNYLDQVRPKPAAGDNRG